ncbi:MAG: hypothetical protein ABI467_29170 [Kofleriaceae bacterium]
MVIRSRDVPSGGRKNVSLIEIWVTANNGTNITGGSARTAEGITVDWKLSS